MSCIAILYCIASVIYELQTWYVDAANVLFQNSGSLFLGWFINSPSCIIILIISIGRQISP